MLRQHGDVYNFKKAATIPDDAAYTDGLAFTTNRDGKERVFKTDRGRLLGFAAQASRRPDTDVIVNGWDPSFDTIIRSHG